MVTALTFGRAVAILRAHLGWTQARLAREMGINESYVSLVESGRRVPSPRLRAEIVETMAPPPRKVRR